MKFIFNLIKKYTPFGIIHMKMDSKGCIYIMNEISTFGILITAHNIGPFGSI